MIEATGYSRPHTVHCGPDGIYVSALGDAKGDDAGRRVPDGSGDLRRARPLGSRPRAAASRLRCLVASRLRHHGDQRMGHAEHDRERAGARDSARRAIWAAPAFLGPAKAQASPGDRFRPRLSARVRAQAGARSDQGLRLRQLRDQPEGPLGVDLDLVSRRRQMGGEEDHRDSGRAGRSRSPAAGAEGLQGGAAAGHRYRPLDGRPLPLCRLLGHRRSPPIRRERSVQPEAHRQSADRRHRLARAAHPGAKRPLQRRPANGRDQPRRKARLFHQLALWRGRSAILSGRHRRLDGEARRRRRRRHRLRSALLRATGRRATARIRFACKAATAPPTPTAIRRLEASLALSSRESGNPNPASRSTRRILDARSAGQ